MEGGSKVAYDPRDLVGAGNGGSDDSKIPKLTLLEEVLLLGIKDRAVSFRFGDPAASPEGPSCLAAQLAQLSTRCCTSVHWEPYNIANVGALGASLLGLALEYRTDGERIGVSLLLERQYIICTARMHHH